MKVTNETELRNAAVAGYSSIELANNITITSPYPIVFVGSVDLFSLGTRKSIRFDVTMNKDFSKSGALVFTGVQNNIYNVRISNDYAIGFTDRSKGYIALIKAENRLSRIRISECVITGANFANVWLESFASAVIEDCSIANAYHDYFSYGIWIGGDGGMNDSFALIRSCVFKDNRHHIARHANQNHTYVEFCDFGYSVKHAVDQHAEPKGTGGGMYHFSNCKWTEPTRFAYGLQIPHGNDRIVFVDCKFARQAGANGVVTIPNRVDENGNTIVTEDMTEAELLAANTNWFVSKHNRYATKEA